MISDMAREAMERDRLLVQRKEKASRITESMHATNGLPNTYSDFLLINPIEFAE